MFGQQGTPLGEQSCTTSSPLLHDGAPLPRAAALAVPSIIAAPLESLGRAREDALVMHARRARTGPGARRRGGCNALPGRRPRGRVGPAAKGAGQDGAGALARQEVRICQHLRGAKARAGVSVGQRALAAPRAARPATCGSVNLWPRKGDERQHQSERPGTGPKARNASARAASADQAKPARKSCGGHAGRMRGRAPGRGAGAGTSAAGRRARQRCGELARGELHHCLRAPHCGPFTNLGGGCEGCRQAAQSCILYSIQVKTCVVAGSGECCTRPQSLP